MNKLKKMHNKFECFENMSKNSGMLPVTSLDYLIDLGWLVFQINIIVTEPDTV